MVRHGHGSQTTEDFRLLIERFLKEAEFPFEPPSRRRCIKIDQTRDWPTGLNLFFKFNLFFFCFRLFSMFRSQ